MVDETEKVEQTPPPPAEKLTAHEKKEKKRLEKFDKDHPTQRSLDNAAHERPVGTGTTPGNGSRWIQPKPTGWVR